MAEAYKVKTGSRLDRLIRRKVKHGNTRTLLNASGLMTFMVVRQDDWASLNDEVESLRETLDVLSNPETMADLAEAKSEDPANRIGMDEAWALLTERKAREAGSV